MVCSPSATLQFWEDHPGSEKQLWFFIKDTLLEIQGIPINHGHKDENSQRACSKGKECPAGPYLTWAAQGKCCVRHGLCTVPRVLLGVMVMPGNEASPAQQAGLYQPHPKPSWAALEQEPQFKCQTKPQEDSGLVPQGSARALPVLLLHSHWALLGRCESNCSNWLQKAQLPWDTGFFHSYGVCP